MAGRLLPVFIGSYAGDLIYPGTYFDVPNMMKYIDTMEVVYDESVSDFQTGFTKTKYISNNYNAAKTTGEISITLHGDLPHGIMSRLVQLAKACMGSGMVLQLEDNWATDKTYNCRWENAADFVENNAVLSGGSISLKFYQVT